MGKIILLGTSAAIPTEEADFTHLVVISPNRTVLIDTSSNPFTSLHKAEIEPKGISDLILTHFHPDHVSGLPLLMMGMWLTGRKTALDVYGLDYTLDRARKMLDLFNISDWPDSFPVNYHPFRGDKSDFLFEDKEIRILGSEVKHLIPTMGLRFEFMKSGKTLAYSCDTEPCPAVISLAKNVDILLHESSGKSKGHSSAEQAGEVAAKAGAKSLYLIHYPAGKQAGELITEARKKFTGEVFVARDLQVFPMD